MLKRYTLVVFLFLKFLSIFSQDRVITIENDTIECAIIKITDYSVYFEDKDKDTTYINLIFINQIEWNGKISKVNQDSRPPKQLADRLLKFGFNLGVAYRINKDNAELRDEIIDYYNGLRFGRQFSANAHYYLRKQIGIGVHYGNYTLKNSKKDVTISANIKADLEDDITIHFIGPSFSLKPFQNIKNDFYINFCLGYANYINDVSVDELKGDGIGSSIALTYDFLLNDNFQLGVQLAYSDYFISAIQFEERRYESYVPAINNFRNLELSIGLRISK